MTNTLLRELESESLVKDFVKTYRVMGVDVGDQATIEYLGRNSELLMTMIGMYQFGVARKLSTVIKLIKEKKNV